MSVCIHPVFRPTSCDFVVCDGPISLSAHRGIFNFNSEVYLECNPNSILITITDVIGELTKGHGATVRNLHITVGWEGLFTVLLWGVEDNTVQRSYLLLKDAGMTRFEIEPFLESPISDIFPNIYYTKRFDVLRRLCSMAKKKVEHRFPKMTGKILCHLVARDEGVIAASSL